MTDQDLRVRQLAYRIWESEGRPVGQEQRHWDMALKIVNAERGSDEDASGDASPGGAPPDEASPEERLAEEDAPMDDRGASDYAQPEPPTSPAQAPVSPGSDSGVVAKAEKKARDALGKATGTKATKPRTKATGSKAGTGSRAKKAPGASTRKPKGSE